MAAVLASMLLISMIGMTISILIILFVKLTFVTKFVTLLCLIHGGYKIDRGET